MKKEPILYVVATPIGNLDDMSARAVNVMTISDFIIAEDTRKARILLNKFNISKKRVVSFFEGNEKEKISGIVKMVKNAECCSLISEAGTPCVSDPGYRLVRTLRDDGINVVPVPGPCAAIAALSASGIASDRFAFEGYLPKGEKKLEKFLSGLENEERTLLFYESPRRIQKSLAVMIKVFGSRKACLFREMTKMFEESIFGTLEEIRGKVSEPVRGEVTLVVAPPEKKRTWDIDFGRAVQVIQEETGISKGRAAKLTAKITGAKKRDIYKEALKENEIR